MTNVAPLWKINHDWIDCLKSDAALKKSVLWFYCAVRSPLTDIKLCIETDFDKYIQSVSHGWYLPLPQDWSVSDMSARTPPRMCSTKEEPSCCNVPDQGDFSITPSPGEQSLSQPLLLTLSEYQEYPLLLLCAMNYSFTLIDELHTILLYNLCALSERYNDMV